jgi:hypothetical protein
VVRTCCVNALARVCRVVCAVWLHLIGRIPTELGMLVHLLKVNIFFNKLDGVYMCACVCVCVLMRACVCTRVSVSNCDSVYVCARAWVL